MGRRERERAESGKLLSTINNFTHHIHLKPRRPSEVKKDNGSVPAV